MPTLLEEGLLIADRYRIHELVGSGGSGWVYRATQEPMGRPVAVKVLRTDLPGDDQIHFEARFLREASLAGQLQHPHIVTIHDYGRAPEGFCYLVMEYLEGYTLREVLRKHQVPVKRIMRIFDGICQGLRHAHARGLVHRDVKPSNVFLVRGDGEEWRPKLTDFGLVREVHSDATITEVGTFLGTPQYIAPEQAMGEPADARSDVYSVGVMLYRALCGKLPYAATNPAALAYMHVHQPYPAMAERAPGVEVPSKLENICIRCMKKEPSERYPDAGELLEELRTVARFVLGPDVLPPPDKSASRVAAVALKESEPTGDPEDDLEPRLDTEETDVGRRPDQTDAMDTPPPLPPRGGAPLETSRQTLVPLDTIVPPVEMPLDDGPRRRRSVLLPLVSVLALGAILLCGGVGIGLRFLAGGRVDALLERWSLPALEQPLVTAQTQPPVIEEPVVEPPPVEEPEPGPAEEPEPPTPTVAEPTPTTGPAVVPLPPPVSSDAARASQERQAALDEVREALNTPPPSPEPAVAALDPIDDGAEPPPPAAGLGLHVTNSLGLPISTERVVAPAPTPEPAGLRIEPSSGAPTTSAPQVGLVKVDEVTFTPEEARRTLAWINTATERDLKNAGLYSLGVTNILQQRPYDSIEVFAATHYVGTSSVQAAKYAALR